MYSLSTLFADAFKIACPGTSGNCNIKNSPLGTRELQKNIFVLCNCCLKPSNATPLMLSQGTLLTTLESQKVEILPAPMAHRAVPIFLSVALGHTSANAAKATEGSEYHF